MKISGDYQIEDVVYLKTDIDQRAYIITGVIIRKDGMVYLVSNGGLEYNVYDFELSKERNKLLSLGIENAT